MRGGDPDAAVYWLARMLEAGEDPRFIARRMVILASEDVGNADPQRAARRRGGRRRRSSSSACRRRQLNLAQAAIYLAMAPKSNAAARAIWSARADVREHGAKTPPEALRSTAYGGASARGHGQGYISPHDDPSGSELRFLPPELGERTYYRRSGNGEEATDGDSDG